MNSFDRQKSTLRRLASRCGWRIPSADADRVGAVRDDELRLVAVRTGDHYCIEVARLVTYTPARQCNALNMEPMRAIEVQDARILEWNGKRSFLGAEMFSVLKQYISMNPAETSVAAT